MLTRVFCAIDDQEQSGRAADTAIEIARKTSSELIFFMANPAVLPGRGPLVYLWTKKYIEEYFSEARNRARHSGVFDTRCITRNATDVARAILLEAENANADYIVVGSNFQPGPFRSWKYSITREVAARAHCPTIIVHAEPEPRNLVSRLLAAE
jgi:nucleotide-binding universal stress UspA family protein